MQALTHDDQGRLLAVSSPSMGQAWQYDGNGNLLSNALTTTAGTTITSYGDSAAITPNEVLTLTTPGQPTTH